jgi:hypothetical protein
MRHKTVLIVWEAREPARLNVDNLTECR